MRIILRDSAILELEMKQSNSPKKATNISLPMDVYLCAKELGINISQVCEQSLRETIRAEQEREWNEKKCRIYQSLQSKSRRRWRGISRVAGVLNGAL
jgi:post-segregation antitoxin (ccd killing protein)